MPPSRIDAVVCDAGPLIALGRLDLLGLLPRLFRQAYVPEAVLAECVARPALLDAQRIRSACDSGQLIVRAATPIAARSLGIGERSAIGAALEISAALLADDRAARRQALALGIILKTAAAGCRELRKASIHAGFGRFSSSAEQFQMGDQTRAENMSMGEGLAVSSGVNCGF